MRSWCWVNFQCRGVLLIWIRGGQGPTALAVCAGGGGCLDIFTLVYRFSFLSTSLWESAGGGCLDIFTLVYRFSFLSTSLWKTARYRLKCCLKWPLSPKQLNY